MNARHYVGEVVRLAALHSENDIEVMKRWMARAASWRVLDTVGGARLPASADPACFLIFTLNGDRPIGHAGLFNIESARGQAWLGIGLSGPEHWDMGYGADAIRLVLRHAFNELNLLRVRLGVFDYDARALRSYEQAGFDIEGRMLQETSRDGRMKAGVYMGLPREKWLATSAA